MVQANAEGLLLDGTAQSALGDRQSSGLARHLQNGAHEVSLGHAGTLQHGKYGVGCRPGAMAPAAPLLPAAPPP
jgi:hypothetical protein